MFKVNQKYNLDGIIFEITKIYPGKLKIKISGTTTYGSKSVDERLEIQPTTKSYSTEEFLQFISEYKLELQNEKTS